MRPMLSGRVVKEMRLGLEQADKLKDVLTIARLARAVQDSLEGQGYDVETMGLNTLRDTVLEVVRELD